MSCTASQGRVLRHPKSCGPPRLCPSWTLPLGLSLASIMTKSTCPASTGPAITCALPQGHSTAPPEQGVQAVSGTALQHLQSPPTYMGGSSTTLAHCHLEKGSYSAPAQSPNLTSELPHPPCGPKTLPTPDSLSEIWLTCVWSTAVSHALTMVAAASTIPIPVFSAWHPKTKGLEVLLHSSPAAAPAPRFADWGHNF